MSAVSISLIAFACVFGGALLGMMLRSALPAPHRDVESKDLVRAATGLVATISALVLGLLVASAKGTYDTQKDEVTTQAAKIALFDQIMVHYGPETGEIRRLLREVVAEEVDAVWSPNGRIASAEESAKAAKLFDMVQDLSPASEPQRGIKAVAGQVLSQLGQTRFLMEAQKGSRISPALIVVVVFWLTINFISFGLFAPRHATATTTLVVCALSVAGAIFLILEMSQPYEGVLRIPDAILRTLLRPMGG